MITIQELLDKYDAEKNAAKAAKKVWERNHCGRKFATRRGMSAHHARDAACNVRETEYKRSCQSFVIFPNGCEEAR